LDDEVWIFKDALNLYRKAGGMSWPTKESNKEGYARLSFHIDVVTIGVGEIPGGGEWTDRGDGLGSYVCMDYIQCYFYFPKIALCIFDALPLHFASPYHPLL